MERSLVQLKIDGPIAEIALNDPARRNALGTAMFDELERAIAQVAGDAAVHVLLLRGEGPVFCAGFDLVAASADPALMAVFIRRLSMLTRSLRRMPQVVVASVQGAAIAGGCAILTACDFVFVASDARLGYPVHRIGVSPAVTIPTLQQAVGPGQARRLLMEGELIDGAMACAIGLATHLVRQPRISLDEARAHCRGLARKGPHALRVTKHWLNELDGSLADEPFERTAAGSGAVSMYKPA